MSLLSDVKASISALSHVVFTIATKTDEIVSNSLEVGVIASREWEQDALFDARKSQVKRARDLVQWEQELLELSTPEPIN